MICKRPRATAAGRSSARSAGLEWRSCGIERLPPPMEVAARGSGLPKSSSGRNHSREMANSARAQFQPGTAGQGRNRVAESPPVLSTSMMRYLST